MGKEFKNIDELFHAELGGAVTKAPDFVKANIDKSLGFRKGKSFFLFGGIIAVLAIVGTILLMTSNAPDFSQMAMVQEKSTVPLIKEFTTHPSNTIETTDPIQIVAIENSNIPNNQAPIQSGSHLNIAQTSPVTPLTNSFTASTLTNQRIQSNTSDTTTPIAAPAPISTNTPNNVSPTLITEETSVPTTPNSNTTPLTSNVDTTIAIETPSFAVINPNDTLPTTSSTLIANNEITENVTPQEESNSNEPSIEPVPAPLINTEEITPEDQEQLSVVEAVREEPIGDTDTTALITTEETVTIDSPEESTYRPITLSLTSGVNWLNAAYTSNNVGEENLYDNGATERLGGQTNLDLTYRLKNGLAFGTGLGLVNYDEMLDFKTTITELDSVETIEPVFSYDYTYGYHFILTDTTGTIDSVKYVVDSTLVMIDSTTVYSTTYNEVEKQVAARNKAHYLNIPLHLGTQIIWRKFQFDIFASFRFNFLLKSSGIYYNEHNFFTFNKDNSIYKSFYVDWMLGSKVHYNVWKNFSLTGSLQYRPVSGNAFKTDLITFNKSFAYLHLGAGISYKF